MDLDRILERFNAREVEYLLIGGVNFLLRHEPVLTYDVDLWIDDTERNRQRAAAALTDLEAEWGATEQEWRPVAKLPRGWMEGQAVFCLTSPAGAIDVFRSVRGLASWGECRARALAGGTASGTPYLGLSDADMLSCQMALPQGERNQSRIEALRKILGGN